MMKNSRLNREAASVSRRRSLFRTPNAERRTPSSAFTLIELLVVVMIMLVLAAVTMAAINISIDGDKVRSGGRQVQSYLEGARSRAAVAKEPRGVRFLLDPTDNRTVSSMVYIAPTDWWTAPGEGGTAVLERLDADNDGDPTWNEPGEQFPGGQPSHIPPYVEDPTNASDNKDDVWVLRGFDGAETLPPFSAASPAKLTNWKDLFDRGLIRDGNLVEIPPQSKNFYAIDTRLLKVANPNTGTPPVRLLLQTKYRTQAETTPSTTVRAFNKQINYRLQLNPAPLANQEPTQLPKGVVVHLDRSSSDPDGRFPAASPSRDPKLRGNRLPETWKSRPSVPNPPLFPTANPAGFDYRPYCDIMFGPRGAVDGPEAAAGIIHLYVGLQKDADRDRADWSVAPPAAGAWWSAPEYLPAQTASDPSGSEYQRGDRMIVSIFTRTGAITTNPIHPDDDAASDAARQGKRFVYSETGEVAGK